MESSVARHDNHFNLIRFVLASLVILSHSPEIIDGDRHRELLTRAFGTISFGEFAVDGFFILSGYLIVMSWHRRVSTADYLARRVLRIYPGFVVAALVCAFVVGPIGSENASGYLRGIQPIRLLSGLVRLELAGVPASFPGTHYASLNGSLWTLAYEFRCYLLVALLGLLGLYARRWTVATLAAVLLVLSALPDQGNFEPGRVIIALFGVPMETIRLTACFLVGAAFWLYRDRVTIRTAGLIVVVPALIGCLFNARVATIGMAVFGGYLLLWLAFVPNHMLSMYRRFPDVSYGVYLYAWPFQKLLIKAFDGIDPWTLSAITWVVSIAAGYASWMLVERRFVARGRSRRAQSVQHASNVTT